ncbi:MAG: hypothetical protein AAGC60_21395 [Acidobacteriota bacterium]
MIAPLRRRHRILVLVLTVAVAPLAVLALVQRPAPPPVERPQGDGPPTVTLDGSSLTVHPARALPHPDLLAYLTDTAATGTAATDTAATDTAATDTAATDTPLPADAVLLGPVSPTAPTRLDLPADAPRARLVLYSLGHRQIVERIDLPAAASTGDVR